MPPVLEKIRQESKTLNAELRARTMSFVLGGLGLVAGLAWNDAVKALIDHLLPIGRESVLAKFIYAVLISVVVVVFSVYLSRLLTRKDHPSDEK